MNQIFTKVFLWMFIGLAITFGVGYYVSTNDVMLGNVFSNYFWIIVIAEIAVALFLGVRIRKMSPTTATISYCLYSLLSGLTFSSVFVTYKLESIIWVFAITAIVMLVMSIIGYVTKMDLTKLGSFLLMALIATILVSIANIFIGSETFDLGINIVVILVFVGYTAYDVQVIKRNLYGIENEQNLAIYGALELYLDFINIFIRLLEIFGDTRD